MKSFKSRAEIKREIAKREKAIKTLKVEINELNKANIKFCDRNSWFEERDQMIMIWARPKIQVQMRIGYRVWEERFRDESTGESVVIKRCEAWTYNGSWDKRMELAKASDKGIADYRKKNPRSTYPFKNAESVEYVKSCRKSCKN